MLFYLLLAACGDGSRSPPPAGAPVAVEPVAAPVAVEPAGPVSTQGCPPGMVRVEGAGSVGMRGQPYAIVKAQGQDAPEQACPAAVAATPGAVACWVQTDEVDPVVPERPVEVAPFCIEAAPFPGAGAAYTTDGLTPLGAQRLAEALATGRYGPRRLCTMTEWQAAVAGLRGNRRFIYGDDAPGERCGSDSLEVGPIGADPRCRNPETGVSDYGAVLSHWVVADDAFLAFACTDQGGGCLGAGHRPLSPGDLVVAGGTRRVQTRQAPLTPHTWHDHGQPSTDACTGELVWDDQPVICADPLAEGEAPDPAAEQAWQALVEVARSRGSMQAVLAAASGPDWCEGPAGQAPPGSGGGE